MPEDNEYYQMPQPIMGHTTEGSLKFQLDIDSIIEDIEHNIKGERLTIVNGKEIWKTPKGIPKLINQKGVNNIIAMLRIRLSKIFILSDLDEDDIYAIMKTIWDDMTDDFYYNWNEYELDDSGSTASMVKHLVCDAIFATLRKSYKKNYLTFLSKTHNVQEMQHRAIQERAMSQQQSESKDPLNFLFGRKRR